MRHHMGSVIRVTSPYVDWVMGMEAAKELPIMFWLGVLCEPRVDGLTVLLSDLRQKVSRSIAFVLCLQHSTS